MIEIYDIETLSNCYTHTGMNKDTQEIKQFVIHNSRNDLIEYVSYLKQLKGQIGFNNISFDGQVIHYILDNAYDWLEKSGDEIAKLIYAYSQKVIITANSHDFSTKPDYFEWTFKIPQLDLFKICHFDNAAKRTSLKDIEFWMNYPNVQDMPIKHTDTIISFQIQEILDYNLNDVKATYAFYLKCKGKIDLRHQLSKQYGLSLMNANDPKIGSEIFLDLLAKDMNVNKYELKKLRTKRSSILLSECILDYVKFNSKEFNKLLDEFKNTILVETKGELKKSIVYKGMKYDYGTGGIHGCIKAGVYEADIESDILDIDVSSFYPNLAIVNDFKPAHLGESFTKIYKKIYQQRSEAKKAGNKAVNEGLKLALNGAYGKSNSVHSFLYDPKFTMCITINGQLLITMLAEKLVDLTNCEILQVNTDGLTIRHKKSVKDDVVNICKEWEELTKLELEYKNYTKMVIVDVNNYAAQPVKGDIKSKGLFEIEKESHKDSSFKVIPIVLNSYFFNNIPLDDIKKHKNIYDFCGRAKFKSDSYGETHHLTLNQQGNYELETQKQQKTTRYYISNKGATFMKIYPNKNSEEFINKGYQVTVLNDISKAKQDLDINYDYYIKECNKIIDQIENKQLTLF